MPRYLEMGRAATPQQASSGRPTGGAALPHAGESESDRENRRAVYAAAARNAREGEQARRLRRAATPAAARRDLPLSSARGGRAVTPAVAEHSTQGDEQQQRRPSRAEQVIAESRRLRFAVSQLDDPEPPAAPSPPRSRLASRGGVLAEATRLSSFIEQASTRSDAQSLALLATSTLPTPAPTATAAPPRPTSLAAATSALASVASAMSSAVTDRLAESSPPPSPSLTPSQRLAQQMREQRQQAVANMPSLTATQRFSLSVEHERRRSGVGSSEVVPSPSAPSSASQAAASPALTPAQRRRISLEQEATERVRASQAPQAGASTEPQRGVTGSASGSANDTSRGNYNSSEWGGSSSSSSSSGAGSSSAPYTSAPPQLFTSRTSTNAEEANDLAESLTYDVLSALDGTPESRAALQERITARRQRVDDALSRARSAANELQALRNDVEAAPPTAFDEVRTHECFACVGYSHHGLMLLRCCLFPLAAIAAAPRR